VDYSTAKASGLTFASVKNKDGSFIRAVAGVGDGGRGQRRPQA